MMMLTTLRDIALIVCAATLTALAVNALSPRGIALVGQWDVEKGVVSAVSKHDVVDYQREIKRVEDAFALYQAGESLFVDARDDDLFAQGHITGAAHLFVYDYDNVIDAFVERYPDKDRLIVTYCSGRECEDSHTLAQYLTEEGYRHVKVFIDGFPAWEKEGLPVERDH